MVRGRGQAAGSTSSTTTPQGSTPAFSLFDAPPPPPTFSGGLSSRTRFSYLKNVRRRCSRLIKLKPCGQRRGWGVSHPATVAVALVVLGGHSAALLQRGRARADACSTGGGASGGQ